MTSAQRHLERLQQSKDSHQSWLKFWESEHLSHGCVLVTYQQHTARNISLTGASCFQLLAEGMGGSSHTFDIHVDGGQEVACKTMDYGDACHVITRPLLLVAMPFAPSSVLAPSSDALCS